MMLVLVLATTYAQAQTEGSPPPCLDPRDDSAIPDLTAPSGDLDYDRYNQQVAQFELGLEDLDEEIQLSPGVSGIFDPGLLHENGTVFTEELFDAPNHYLEHWFINVPKPNYNGAAELGVLAQGDSTFDPGLIYHSDWESDTYLRMDVKLKQAVGPITNPNTMDLDFEQSPILKARAFNVLQGNVILGWMLRTKHENDNWQDFWLLQEGFDLVGDGGNDMVLDAIPTPANTKDFLNNYVNQYSIFTLVTYKVRKGCAYYEPW